MLLASLIIETIKIKKKNRGEMMMMCRIDKEWDEDKLDKKLILLYTIKLTLQPQNINYDEN